MAAGSDDHSESGAEDDMGTEASDVDLQGNIKGLIDYDTASEDSKHDNELGIFSEIETGEKHDGNDLAEPDEVDVLLATTSEEDIPKAHVKSLVHEHSAENIDEGTHNTAVSSETSGSEDMDAQQPNHKEKHPDRDRPRSRTPPVSPRPVRKRPAMSNELCGGCSSAKCTWSLTSLNEPARIQSNDRCIFCSASQLEKAEHKQGGREITIALRKIKALSSDKYLEAIANLRNRRDDAFAEDFQERVKRAENQRQKISRAAAREVLPPEEKWRNLLTKRLSVKAKLNATKQLKYENEVLRDRTLARRKIFFPENIRKHITSAADAAERAELPLPASDATNNDTGMPSPTTSARAQSVELWCKHGSWVSCETCGSLRPRPLQPNDLRRLAQPTVPRCVHCTRKHYVPQLGDVPMALQGLGHRSLSALRPLEIDTGVYERAQYGYRVHTGMVSFAWATHDVVDKINALTKRRHKVAARAAYDYLMNSKESAYRDFVKRHRHFLQRHPHADERHRKQPLRFIEEEGLECSIWPHLYWRRDLCETVERATDVRRLRARHTGITPASGRQYNNSDSDKTTRGDKSRLRKLPIQTKYATMICAGTKVVEGRTNTGIAAEIRVGDRLQLGSVTKRVEKVMHFKGFKEMLENVGVKKALPDCNSVREGVAIYHSFRNYANLARNYGVVAFRLANDTNPSSRKRRRRNVEDSSDDGSHEDEPAPNSDTDDTSNGSDREHGRHSIRRSFLRKVVANL